MSVMPYASSYAAAASAATASTLSPTDLTIILVIACRASDNGVARTTHTKVLKA